MDQPSDITLLYGEGYQQGSVDPRALNAWVGISDVLVRTFEGREWCDVGCGGGGLLVALQNRGKQVWGIEGSEAAVGLSPPPIVIWDLRTPLTVIQQVDVVTCFDVAEHVGAAEVLVDTLTDLSADWVLFGAAPPGQDGLGHIDLRPHEEWTALFVERGYSWEIQATREVKEQLGERDGVNYLWWVEKNFHAYRRRSQLSQTHAGWPKS